MSDEIKSVVEAGLKGVGDKLEAAITKFEGQYAEAGKTDNEIKAEVKALSDKFEAAVTEIAQKMEAAGEQTPDTLTAGSEFVKSEQFKALQDRQVTTARIEVKNTVVADGTTTFPAQRPGVIPGNFLPVTLRQHSEMTVFFLYSKYLAGYDVGSFVPGYTAIFALAAVLCVSLSVGVPVNPD